MYPATIASYARAASIDEVLAGLAAGGDDVLCLAGGMSLMQAVKARVVRPRSLIDLSAVAELQGISNDRARLRIGAMARYVDIATSADIGAAHAALRDAAAHVGDRQVRHRGTVGGSLCWNYILACMPTVALCLDAEMELVRLVDGVHQNRRESARAFLVGPMETARAADELLVAIRFPTAPRQGSAYRKWGPATDALPSVGVAMSVALDAEDRCVSARLAITGTMDGPQLFVEAASRLIDRKADEDVIAGSLGEAAEAAGFEGDAWASKEHKRMRVRALGAQVARLAFKRARGGEK